MDLTKIWFCGIFINTEGRRLPSTHSLTSPTGGVFFICVLQAVLRWLILVLRFAAASFHSGEWVLQTVAIPFRSCLPWVPPFWRNAPPNWWTAVRMFPVSLCCCLTVYALREGAILLPLLELYALSVGRFICIIKIIFHSYCQGNRGINPPSSSIFDDGGFMPRKSLDQ